jgi:vacuolar-type H+-ATPase subunit H
VPPDNISACCLISLSSQHLTTVDKRSEFLEKDQLNDNTLSGAGTAPLYNQKTIQRVLEIEKQAQTIRETAVHEAAQQPAQAEREAQALVERARAAAQEEAHQMIVNAQAEEECARIQAQAEEDIERMEALAKSNIDRAVSYVLDQVVGRE